MMQNAFVLHSQPYREHQRLITFFTEQQGKVAALGYPGRSLKTNKAALFQPFLPVQVKLKGSQGLLSLQQIEASAKQIQLSQPYLYAAFYLNELLVRLLVEHIACESLYQLYRNTLQALANQQEIEPLLRCFELNLLDELGYSIDFSACYQKPDESFYFHPEHGLTIAVDEQSLLFDGIVLRSIAEQDFSLLTTRRAAKQLMRLALAPLLGNKPLQSRKLFKP